MPKTIDIHLRLTVEEREGKLGTAENLHQTLRDYLSSPEAPLLDDYGPDAWGGYDGAYITRAEITHSEVK